MFIRNLLIGGKYISGSKKTRLTGKENDLIKYQLIANGYSVISKKQRVSSHSASNPIESHRNVIALKYELIGSTICEFKLLKEMAKN